MNCFLLWPTAGLPGVTREQPVKEYDGISLISGPLGQGRQETREISYLISRNQIAIAMGIVIVQPKTEKLYNLLWLWLTLKT